MMKEVALATMVWRDNWNLRNWVNYYSKYIDRSNLFIFTHDRDEEAEEIAAGCNIVRLYRRDPYPDFDRDRWLTIQHFVNGLLRQFRVVVFNDVDEILVVDPQISTNIVSYILENEVVPINSPFGLDIIHRSKEEEDSISDGTHVLRKRRFARPTSIYTKPCILRREVRFKAGGHGTDHPDLHLSPHIFLLHLRFIDREVCGERLKLRSQITTDQTSGERIQSLGPAIWRLADSEIDDIFDNFNAMKIRHDPDFQFPSIREDFTNRYGQVYSHGLYGIRNKESSYLYELPDRFRDLF